MPTEQELRVAADALLDAVHPDRVENAYFSAFAQEHLRWMMREHRAGRLVVGFYPAGAERKLPTGVLMAAWRTAEESTIFISPDRFAAFLLEAGVVRPPFTARQKNDFALALVHEVLHLQSDADGRDPHARVMEESRVWRAVSIEMVRPLRVQQRPIHPLYVKVDDALRACGDRIPCEALARLVRLGP